MSENHERAAEPRSGDPDWIKGLVAQALIKASETEELSTPSPDAPAARVVPRNPGLPDPPIMGTDGLLQQRLVVGRESTDRSETPDSEGRSSLGEPATAAPTTRPRPSLPQARPRVAATAPESVLDAMSGRSDADVGAPAVAVAERPDLPRVSTDLAPVTIDDTHDLDDIMEPEDVITEGFRSSDIRTVLEWLAVMVSALVVALIIKALVLQAFYIPSESMETTVNEGDRILVNKLSYRLHDVRRGDLVVFKKLPGTASQTDDLIKRAIALPGETIEARADGRIWIWGPGETAADAKRLEEPYLDPQNELLEAPDASMPSSQDIWHEDCVNQPRNPGRCTLDEDHYFMMGDNRGASSDSRFFGPVPEDLIVGRAFLRIWPLGEFSSL